MESTNTILKFRREADCWVCPECDTENGMFIGRCLVCSKERSPHVVVLSAGQVEPYSDVSNPATGGSGREGFVITPSGGSAEGYPGDGYSEYEEKKGNGGKVFLIIIIIFAIIGLLVYMTDVILAADYEPTAQYEACECIMDNPSEKFSEIFEEYDFSELLTYEHVAEEEIL